MEQPIVDLRAKHEPALSLSLNKDIISGILTKKTFLTNHFSA